MATPAIVRVGNEYFCIFHDGYPEKVVPELNDILREAKVLCKKTGRTFEAEMGHLLEDYGWTQISDTEVYCIDGIECFVDEKGVHFEEN